MQACLPYFTLNRPWEWLREWKSDSRLDLPQTRANLFWCVLFRMSAYAQMSNFSCYVLIDGLVTNQITLLLPVRGRTELGKILGIDCRRFLFSPPTPPSRSALLTFPNFLLTSGGTLVWSLHPEKVTKLLLRKLSCKKRRQLKLLYHKTWWETLLSPEPPC